VSPVRVIDQNQQQIGIIPIGEALAMAREAGLDLVEVSPTERPPVCRVMDYGRQKYLQKKKLKVSQAAHVIAVKEIRLRPKTDPHDRGIKVARAQRFLEEGDKVQFTMLFRGRERVHRDSAVAILQEIIRDLADRARVEREPAMDGRRMTMLLAPGKHRPATTPTPGATSTPAAASTPAATSTPGATPTPATGTPAPQSTSAAATSGTPAAAPAVQLSSATPLTPAPSEP